ncbi:MAG: tripartite tricarboxylate transporter TctB family protein [Pseudomonadota bacterium]
MNLRADHVAGAAFIIFGGVIIALSGDLPTGQLSMPGSGFLPKIIAVLMMLFGLALFVRAKESGPLSSIPWDDGKHALMVIVITAAAIALYTQLGFIITMMVMMASLLIIIERKNPLRAAGYSVGVVLVAYVCFAYLLKSPLPVSPFS